MSESKLVELPVSTTRLLGSTQVITSVFSVVKELIENCFDADASVVDVKLENFGIDKVEVRDNGCGIRSADVANVAKRFHTSKISEFCDLEHLSTYGFRGEALGSLCTVSDLSITTRTAEDDISLTYSFNKQGQITSSRPSHLGQGTTITAVDLFKNLPVRRQYYNTNKKKKDELKKVEELLYAYAIIRPDVRISLRHNKDLIWQKNIMPDMKHSLNSVLGRNVVCNLHHEIITKPDPQIEIELYLPKPDGDIQCTGRSNPDRCFTFVNKRPVRLKELEKLIRQYYTSRCPSEASRYPVYCVSIVLPSTELDVNVDPNKTTVYLHHKEVVMDLITDLLENIYGPKQFKSAKVGVETNGIIKDSHVDTFIKNGEMNDSSLLSKESMGNGQPETQTNSVDNHSIKIVPVDPDAVISENIPTYKVTIHENNSSNNLNENHSISSRIENNLSNNDTNVQTNSTLKCDEKFISNMDISETVLPRSFMSEPPTKGTDKGEVILKVADTDQDEQNIPQSQQPVFEIGENLLSDEIDCNVDLTDQKLKSQMLQGASGSRAGVSTSEDSFSDIFDSWKEADERRVVLNGESKKDSGVSPHSVANQPVSGSILIQTDSGELSKSLGGNIEAGKNENCITTMPPAGDLWSKGQSVVGTCSDTIQPVTLLNMGKRPLTSPADSPPQKKRHLSPGIDQPKIFDCVSDKPMKQLNSGFTAFSKEIRHKVVEENPNADYNEVTQILKNMWQNLEPDEKQFYGSDSPLQSKKQTVVPLKTSKQLGKKMKQKPIPQGQSIKDHLIAVGRKASVNVVTKSIPFTLKALKEVYKSQVYCSQAHTSKKLQLIGQLKSCGMWFCCHGNKIQILNHHRIQETALYHKLMSNHVLQTQQLENPIVLSESSVGGTELWQSLINMAQKEETFHTYGYIQDERLSGNGIKIRYFLDKENGDLKAEIIALNNAIPTYGVSDLKEILELISRTQAGTLSESRPLKVINYLQGEAVRMARQLPRQQTQEDIVDLLEQIETELPSECVTCLHNKPFYHTLYDLNDIPLTQTQTQG